MFNHPKKIDNKMLKKEIEKLEKLNDYIKENGYKNYEDAEDDYLTAQYITIFLEDFIKKLTELLDNSKTYHISFPRTFEFSDISKFSRLCNADCDTTITCNVGLKFFIGYAYKKLHNFIFLGKTCEQSHADDFSISNSHKLSTSSTSESEPESELQKPSSSTSESESDHSSSIKMRRHH